MHETALLEQLTEDIGIAHQLLELIDEEFAALGNRDLAGLEAILTKAAFAGTARPAWRPAQSVADRTTTTPDRNGLQAAVSGSPSGETILEQARTLEAELESCRSANERNGRLIRANQSALGSMLHILQGKDDTPDLYDNRGGASKSKQQRPLSQA